MRAEATSEAHVDENFKVLDWELSEDDMTAISGVETQNKNVPASMFLKENGPYVTESDVSPNVSASALSLLTSASHLFTCVVSGVYLW